MREKENKVRSEKLKELHLMELFFYGKLIVTG